MTERPGKKKGKRTEIAASILEDFKAMSPDQRKAWKEKATPEQLKELVKAQAAAKISEGNRKLQELKAKERKEDTRRLILLGALFKRLLASSSDMLTFVEKNISQEIAELKEFIQQDKEELEKYEQTLAGQDMKNDKEALRLRRELSKDKKILKDTEIILDAIKALKDQAADQTANAVASSDQQSS